MSQRQIIKNKVKGVVAALFEAPARHLPVVTAERKQICHELKILFTNKCILY
jgi:hypothetical protein